MNWFARNARDLPWRRTRDPYAIWVSEIMLQQTQVRTVLPYWKRWMRDLPTLQALAQASPDKIHKLWEGLGYYTRVRNLQQAARFIVENHGGRFPRKFDEVLALPGIGRYTAGAICSIAFHQPTPVLDGNIIRVLTRLFGIGENPGEKETNRRLWRIADQLVTHASRTTPDVSRITIPAPRIPHPASALNQSLMELGALICTPRRPKCDLCPVAPHCCARREHRVDQLPHPPQRLAPTARRFAAFVVEHRGRFLVRQRPAGVVNAQLWEFPNIELKAAPADLRATARHALGFSPRALKPLGAIKHSITRYRITLETYQARCEGTSGASPAHPDTKPGRPAAPSFQTAGVWLKPVHLRKLAFTAAHRRVWDRLLNRAP